MCFNEFTKVNSSIAPALTKITHLQRSNPEDAKNVIFQMLNLLYAR